MTSLKTRIITTLTALLVIGGSIDACASYWLAHKRISELLDAHLQGAAVWLAAGKVGAVGADGPPQHSIDGFVGQVWKRGVAQPVDNTDSGLSFDRNAPDGFSMQTVGGDRFRVYTLRKADGALTYQVGQPVAFRERTAAQSALASLLPMAILIPLVWIAIVFVVNAAFVSLARASVHAESVGIGRLEPFDLSHVPDEVRSFAESINRMMARIQTGIDTEKRFIADAAHELRTPVSALQLRLDNLANASDDAARTERMQDLRDAIARSAMLIRQMLELARADVQVNLVDLAPVDLQDLVQTLVADFLPIADARAIDLGVKRFERAHVKALGGDLRMAVRNLIANALNYTPTGGRVDIELFSTAGNVLLRVIDTGPGIPDESLARVFDRFYRLPVGNVEGSGLGLSIVKSVVAKYGGAVWLANRSDGMAGLTATIRLPGTLAVPATGIRNAAVP